MRNVLVLLTTLLVCGPRCVVANDAQTDATGVLRSRCLHCHDAEQHSGDVDMSSLLESTDDTVTQAGRELWTRIEQAVTRGQMPPQDEPPLPPSEQTQIVRHYRSEFILRDGRDHIGVTPLRRLTRYELENTLEDLLSVKLKQPYVFSSQSAGLQPSTIEQLYPADTLGASGFDNDAEQLRNVKVSMVKYIACIDFALRMFDQDPEARKELFGFTDKATPVSATRAEEILKRFLDQASRGTATQDDLRPIVRAWEKHVTHATPYQALLRAMKLALLSPAFLYRLESHRGSAEPYPVQDHELAVRLAYFLWSSMPDQALVDAAQQGTLATENGLRQQITRMLNSPKRIALAENFAGQWLGFDEIKHNKVFYQGENWTRGVYDELLFGFDELIKSDRSLLEIIDADWAYLRQEKSRSPGARRHQHELVYADIFAARSSRKGLKVERFYSPPQLYQLESDRLGGLLTAAGIMRLTSAPNRTNPIRRGVWLLEQIIGEEMHPPENIPPLAEAKKKIPSGQATSPREILKIHTAQASCQACHQHIDPLGLGLENFSPTGEWRTTYEDKTPILSQGKLPNGHEFRSPQELKQALLGYYQERIVDNIIRKMLAYAIGRKIEPHDRVTLEQIHSTLAKHDYRMGVLIEQIILSKQFRCRQDSI